MANQIPVGVYIVKIASAESKLSAVKSDGKGGTKGGEPMFVLNPIILSKDGSDIVDGTEGEPIVVGGRDLQTMYVSFSPKAVTISKDRLRAMGVSEEALNELNTTAVDNEWAVQYLRDRCFQAVIVPDITYVCTDGRARTEGDLKRFNKETSSAVKFLESGGKPLVRGARLEITDIVGAATSDGQPI